MPALLEPLRPKKLRLLVRTLTALVQGLCPMPMQKPHAVSQMRAPASIMSCSAPLALSMLSTCRLPGAMTSDTSGFTVLPFRMAATRIMSR